MNVKKSLCVLLAAALICGAVPAAAFAEEGEIQAADRNAFTAMTADEAVLIQEEGYEEWTVPIEYSGAPVGEKEVIAALLTAPDPENESEESVIFYEVIARNSESGSADIVIPSGLTAGEYSLQIISEERNEAGEILEAGEPVRIVIAVTERTEEDGEMTEESDPAEEKDRESETGEEGAADASENDETAEADEMSEASEPAEPAGSGTPEEGGDSLMQEDSGQPEKAAEPSGSEQEEKDTANGKKTDRSEAKKTTEQKSGNSGNTKKNEDRTKAEGTEASEEKNTEKNVFAAGDAAGGIPDDVQKAMNFFTEDAASFSEVVNMSKLTQILQRFGGVGSFASGCVAVLKLFGIIEDPQESGIKEILSEVADIQTKLQTMDLKLDKITQMLIDLAVRQEEKDRQNKARELLSFWRTFNSKYKEDLDLYVNEYQNKVNQGIRSWWEEETHEGVRILYTDLQGETALTYSKEAYPSGFPKKADNGEAILQAESIGIPSEYMPKTAAESFDINHYDKRMKKLASKAILSAAKAGKLDASKSFYKKWETLSDEEKKAAADNYAADLLSTVVYRISCKVMEQNSEWVTDLITEYGQYCDNILLVDSGIDALIKVQYMTHGFEGEVKDAVTNICDYMITSAGYYGVFALSAAGQDPLQTDASKKALRQKWADTINHLNEKKTAALTGYDNYCYVVGAVVDFKEMGLRSTMQTICTQPYPDGNHQCFRQFSSEPWKIVDADGKEADLPGFLSDTYALVLYHQYLSQKPDDKQSFNAFLGNNGVSVPADFSGMLMTDFGGTENFSLADALPMKAKKMAGSYFKTDQDYLIDKGTGRKVKGGNYVLHDKVVYDCLDPATGTIAVSQVCAARAAYCEGHWYWWTDEVHMFAGNADLSVDHEVKQIVNPWSGSNDYRATDTGTLSAPLFMLSLSSVSEEAIPADSPLKAFESCQIMDLPEEEEETPEESDADWSSLTISMIKGYEEDDERIEEGILSEIDNAVTYANEQGLAVSLSDTEKAQLSAKMREMIFSLQEELGTSPAVDALNVFGLEGNDASEISLAKEVLPCGYLDGADQLSVSPANMTVMARYEPGVWLSFEEKSGKAETILHPAFNIDPMLVIWDSKLEEFAAFEISDEIMSGLGLKMTVRIPAGAANGASSVRVRHYDMTSSFLLLEEKNLSVQGSGTDRYAVMEVTQCSPFELIAQSGQVTPAPTVKPSSASRTTAAKTSSVKTGDENSAAWMLVLFFAALAVFIPTVCIYRKKR